MDQAYDHIASESYSDRAPTPTQASTTRDPNSATAETQNKPTLQTELRETFAVFQSSPWASRLGGFWNTARKQGESYYAEARREAEAASEEALKGFNDFRETIVKKTRGLSVGEEQAKAGGGGSKFGHETSAETQGDGGADAQIQENETFISRFQWEAAKRLKDIERAEDAADEALLRFGTNIRNFLKDAVSVAPPSSQPADGGEKEMLFESRDQSGKRVIHASRLEAHLHVIHSTSTSFTEDPSGSGGEWETFRAGFQIETKTDEIARDLDKYPELRSMMEKLVPDKVDYDTFWCRYYFLRHVVDTQEQRRKELLQASAHNTEEVAWEEDSDDEAPRTPQIQEPADSTAAATTPRHVPPLAANNLIPTEGRRSHDEKSVADSDASYDLVSGATSRAPGSPKEEMSKPALGLQGMKEAKDEESDEDWE